MDFDLWTYSHRAPETKANGLRFADPVITRFNKGAGGSDIKRRLWISWERPPSPAFPVTSHPAGGAL